MANEKYTLELPEFDVSLILSGLAILAITFDSKADLPREKRDELANLVARVRDEIIQPAAAGNSKQYNEDTVSGVNRLIEDISLRLLSRHEGAAD